MSKGGHQRQPSKGLCAPLPPSDAFIQNMCEPEGGK